MYDFDYDLKRCPFCNGVAHIEKAFGTGIQRGDIGYIIKCSGCETQTPFDCMSNHYYNSKTKNFDRTRDDHDVINKLVERWNRRTKEVSK